MNLVQEVDQNEKNFTQEMWLLKKQESTKDFDFFHAHRQYWDVSNECNGG